MPQSQAPQGQARTVAQPPRLPLVSTLDTRTNEYTSISPYEDSNLQIQKDARLVNGYIEMDPNDQKNRWIYKRPGVGGTALYAPAAGVGRGVCAINNYSGSGVLYYVVGDTLYGNGANLGTLSTSTGPVSLLPGPPLGGWAGNPTVPILMIYDGTYGYFYSPGGIYTGLNQLGTSNNFTTNPIVPGFVFADSYFYIMDAYGNIWGTQNQNDPRYWPVLDVIVAGNEPSPGVALAKQLAYVVAFKQNSIQVFYTAGGIATTEGSPLQNIPEAQIPLGCMNGNTVAGIDEVLLWVTFNGVLSPQVARMTNLSTRICSTPAVERILSNISWARISTPDVFAYTMKIAGHRFYVLTSIPAQSTLVYDIDQNYWSFWTNSNPAAANYWPFIGSVALPAVGDLSPQLVTQSIANGGIYPIDGAYIYPNDLNQSTTVDIYTPNFDAGVDRRKMLNMMRFNADQTPGSLLQVRHSDDDYQSWSNFRTVDLGLERPFLKNEGTFRRRAYHIRHAAQTSLRIKSVDLTMDIGTL